MSNDITHVTTPKTATRGTQIQHTRWPERPNLVRWRLPFVLSEEPGSCHLPGAWNFKLAHIYGKSVHPGVASCQMHFCATGCKTHNSVCSSQHTLRGTRCMKCKFMLRILCRFRYKCMFRRRVYMCRKLSTQSRQLHLITRNRFLLRKFAVFQLVGNPCSLCNTQIQYRGSCWWSRRYICV